MLARPAPSPPARGPARLLAESRYAVLVLQVGVFLLASLLTRLVLLAMVARADGTPALTALARAVAAGEVYDFLVALWLGAPLALWLSLSRDRPWARRGRRVALGVALACSVALAAFVAIAEVVFFDEFAGRFNFVAVDYLIYPTEVVSNIGQSYPAGWLLAGVAAVTAAVLWLARGRLAPVVAAAPTRGRARAALAALYAVALLALTLAARPALAHVSDDRSLNEAASNGYYTFWQALLGQDAPYAGLYATRPDSAVFARLHSALAEPASAGAPFGPASSLRHVRARLPERRMNVVVVLEESLGSKFIGALHPGAPSLTPHFDSLAGEGTLLTNAYSTGNRTIRALEATTTSLPPLPGISLVRRAASHGLFTLPALLASRGYATEFVYGGRAFFDNMGAYMRANGMEHVVEQSDYPPGLFTTAWGVSDEAIFDMTLRQLDSLDAAGRPFYVQVLSVSNHKPYTYPGGRIAADPNAHQRVNAVEYADWALGRFMRQARDHRFFRNTIFVLMGDHGARVYGAAEIPLPSYEVPILFYAPGTIPAGRRLDVLASSMDLPPTILGLLGVSYDSKFFGRDLLVEDSGAGRAFMTHNSEIAELRGDRMAVLGLRGTTQVYRLDASREGLLPERAPDAGERDLVEEAIAYFDGADRLYRAGGYTFGTPRGRVAAAAR